MINVAIVEDHQDELDGFIRDLALEPDITVVATAANGAEALKQFFHHQPDIVIVDLVLPDTTGSALIVQLRAAIPSASFLVVSAYDDYERIYNAILAGALGYLTKVHRAGELAQAIRDVHAGGSPMSSAIARKVINAFHIQARSSTALGKLTQTEMNILHILATGQSYKDIATHLFVSVNTVRTHVRNIYRKLQIHSWKQINEMDLWGKGK